MLYQSSSQFSRRILCIGKGTIQDLLMILIRNQPKNVQNNRYSVLLTRCEALDY